MIFVVVWRNADATTSPALETTATFALPEPMSMASTYFSEEEEGIGEFRSRLIYLMLARVGCVVRVPQNDRIRENNPAVRSRLSPVPLYNRMTPQPRAISAS
jgi:hypothetical protein